MLCNDGQVEVLQGDTFYSMITNNDTEKIKFYLQDENLNTGNPIT